MKELRDAGIGVMSVLLVGAVHANNSIPLNSASALAFDDANTLFVGDSRSGSVHAFTLTDNQLRDQSSYLLGRASTFEGRTIVEALGESLATLLKTTKEEITVNDLVVHKPNKQIFMSVHVGHGPEPQANVVTVDNGELRVVDLTDAKHTYVRLDSVPNEERLEFGQPLNSLAITDIDYYDGEIFVAGISNEEFSSKLRRIPYPFNGRIGTSSIEIWHAVHAQYETRAPIITQTIAELDGVPTLIAVYACTPIVRIPIEDLVNGAHVKGTMIGEMGYGNTPIDIVQFTNSWDKSENIVVTNTNRSAAQVSLDALSTAQPMPHGEGVKPVFSVAGVSQYALPLSGTMHLDTVDENWAVTIRQNPEDGRSIQLHTLPLPFFFDRADHIVEMNWADGPDPFGYKSAPALTY